MSRAAASKTFLQRASYRQRRLRDAAKLVPFLGFVLLAIPLTWSKESVGASGLVYIFSVWVILIVLSAVLSHGIRFDAPEVDGDAPKK